MSKHPPLTSESDPMILRIREELARRRMSRQRLADEARISVSTLEKVLSGRRTLTLATLVRLEEALGISLRTKRANGSLLAGGPEPLDGIAPDQLGNYARPSVAWLEGTYLTLMPSFGERSAISAFCIEIRWSDVESCLVFRESERIDPAYSQYGLVAMPNQTGHVYLITNRHGQQRLAILSRPANGGAMHGILATLHSGRGAHLTPVAAPIVLTPLQPGAAASFGRISQGHVDFARYKALLRRTLDERFAVLMDV